MKDVQSSFDTRRITINRVGVSDIEFPLKISTKDKKSQVSHASVNMYASLFHTYRGTHMSRFAEALEHCFSDKTLTGSNFPDLVKHIQTVLQADDVYVSASFKYFMVKHAPVSKKKSRLAYTCKFIGVLYKNKYNHVLEVDVPVQLLCPCSKELCYLSEKQAGLGAHNQRALVTIQVRAIRPPGPWFEDLINIAEKASSIDLYTILKRPDEKYVTETAYHNPKFVEDAARDTAVKLQTLKNINWFRVKVVSYESIHNHNAVAYIGREKVGNKWRKSGVSFF